MAVRAPSRTSRAPCSPSAASPPCAASSAGSIRFCDRSARAMTSTGFRRVLSTWDATMVVMGGLIALAGAFAFAELGAVAPKAGGQYVYLRDAFHPLAGFLYGWALLFMIEGGAIAAVAQAFATYLLRALDSTAATTPIAVLAIVLVSAINYVGVRPGSRVLNVFVALKVLALVALIVAGLLLPGAAPGAAATPMPGGSVTIMAFG